MIHCYKSGGFNIVLDVCSASIHVVDDATFDIIELYETKSKEEITEYILDKYSHDNEVTREAIEECFAQIEELKSEGKLFTEDTFKDMANELKNKNAGTVKALCLHIAHTCNLNCSYCFASPGMYHG